MQTTLKRLFSFAMVLMLVFSCVPAAAFAASAPALPTATVSDLNDPARQDLTFAMNFKADEITDEQLAYYGDWYADFVLTVNKKVTFDANGGADGYLAGQYDGQWKDIWNGEWVNVPFKAPVTLEANVPVKIMAFAAEQMNAPGLKYTFKEVIESVKDFNCGIHFEEAYLLNNPDLVVTLELRMYNNQNEAESYIIGETYTYTNPLMAKNQQTGKVYNDPISAVREASAGDTILLLKDVTVKSVIVPAQITLDLNGYSMTANNVSVFGDIIDSSADNSGRLTTGEKKFLIQETNKQLPILTDEGYAFVEILKFNTLLTNGGKQYIFQPMFESAADAMLLNRIAASGISVQVDVNWRNEGENGSHSQNFLFDESFFNSFIQSRQASGKYGKAFYLIINSTTIADLSFTAKVVSNTKVTISTESLEASAGNVQTNSNGQVAQQVTIGNEQASAVVAEGTQLDANTKNLVLTATKMAKTDSNITLETDESLLSMDVHVEGVAKNNTVPVIVTLNQLAPEALNQGNIKLYHVENGVTNEMVRVYSLSELDAHNEYYYDIATGTVTVALASFSEIAVVSNDVNAWNGDYDYSWYHVRATKSGTAPTVYTIANADQLAAFGAIVGGMNGREQDSFDGKTVKLTHDIVIGDLDSENGYVFYPIGYYNNTGSYNKVSGKVTVNNEEVAVISGFMPFQGTFDGNGHTVSDFYQNTWEMFGDYNDGYAGTPNHYRDGMGLFGKVYGGTVKNLTVKNFSSDGEYTTTGSIAAYADCGAKFENIAIFNCNPRVYNIGNGGIVGCVGWYAKEAVAEPVTFTNITVDNTNKISALWGSWDVACGGIVGQYYPTSGQSSANYPKNAGIALNNCHVAAQIDVNNDVCANYQYYAYRYAGMIIGSIRENTTNDAGQTIPNMDGITAEDCTVNYGNWNNYYYCELVANSIASYTHDYQFSRLTQISSLDEIKSGETWLKAGNFLLIDGNEKTCYHIMKDANGNLYQHNHDDSGKQDLDGDGEDETFVEDHRIVFLPFYQLFTGYGWGVSSVGLKDYSGIVTGLGISESDFNESVTKFEKADSVKDSYAIGNAVSVGELFAAIDTGIEIYESNLQVFVSPADENSTVSGTFVRNDSDWTQSTLTFTGTGKATVTITDYYFCEPTTITVNVIGEGKYYIAAYRNSESKYYYMTNDLGTASTKRYQAVAVEDALPNMIAAADANAAQVFELIANEDGTFIIKTGDQYLARTDTSHNSGALVAESDAQVVTLTANKNGTVQISFEVSSEETRYLALNSTTNQNYFAWYKGETKDLILIPVLSCEHTNTKTDSKEATCTEAGYTDRVICSDCGAVIAEGTVVAAKGHTEVIDEAVAPTCTETGLTEGSHCSVCGKVTKEQEEIAATGHTYGDDNICDACGDEIEIEYVTISFNVNGTITEERYEKGSTINLNSVVEVTAYEGYTFAGWVTEAITEDTDSAPTILTGEYTVSDSTTLYAVYTYVVAGEGEPQFVLKDITEIIDTDVVVIVAKVSSKYYAMTNNNGTTSAPAALKVTVNDNMLVGTISENIKWNISNSNGNYTFYPNGSTNTWLYSTNTNNGVRVGVNDNKIFTMESSGYLKNTGTNRYLGVYNSQDWRCYTSTTVNINNQTFTFYVLNSSADITYYTTTICTHGNTETNTEAATCTTPGSVTVTCTDCGKELNKTELPTAEHTWTDATCTSPKTCTVCNATEGEALEHSYEWVTTKESTCTENGTKTGTCSVCEATKTEDIEATGHNYVDGECQNGCGIPEEDEPTLTTKTVSMNIYANKGTLSNKVITWGPTDGVSFKNEQGSTAIRTSDTDHFRIYQNSKTTISAEGQISKIVITVKESKYVDAMTTSLKNAGCTVEASGLTVTVTLDPGVESITFTASAQTRLSNIEVTYLG